MLNIIIFYRIINLARIFLFLPAAHGVLRMVVIILQNSLKIANYPSHKNFQLLKILFSVFNAYIIGNINVYHSIYYMIKSLFTLTFNNPILSYYSTNNLLWNDLVSYRVNRYYYDYLLHFNSRLCYSFIYA